MRRSVWMNRKARKAIRKKTKTWKKYRQTDNAEDHEQYRKALNEATIKEWGRPRVTSR